MKRFAVVLALLLLLCLPGCQNWYWPWHGNVKLTPPETTVNSSVTESAVPTKRTKKKYRIIIRPTSRPVIEEVPRDQ